MPHKKRDEVLKWMTNVIVDYFGAEHDSHFRREIVEVDGHDILHCNVDASKDDPMILKKRLDGKEDFFVRAGNGCRALASKEMLDYMEKRWPKRSSRQHIMKRSMSERALKAIDIAKNLTKNFIDVMS